MKLRPVRAAGACLIVALILAALAAGAVGAAGKKRVEDKSQVHLLLVHPNPRFLIEEFQISAAPSAQHEAVCLGKRRVTLFRNGTSLGTKARGGIGGEDVWGIGDPATPGRYFAKMAERTIVGPHKILVCDAFQSKPLIVTG